MSYRRGDESKDKDSAQVQCCECGHVWTTTADRKERQDGLVHADCPSCNFEDYHKVVG